MKRGVVGPLVTVLCCVAALTGFAYLLREDCAAARKRTGIEARAITLCVQTQSCVVTLDEYHNLIRSVNTTYEVCAKEGVGG